MLVQLRDRFLYLKLCLGRAVSHIGAFKQVAEIALLLGIYLKLLGFDSVLLVGGIAVIGTLALLVVGHFDLKFGIAEAETSLSNKYNPELQRLIKRRR